MARHKQGKQAWSITELLASKYDSRNRANRANFKNPTWEQVRTAILSLDNDRCSDMAIVGADGSCMTIGGGVGRFTVATQCGPESDAVEPATLVHSARGEDEEEIIVGGCETSLPARLIVDEKMTLRAVQRFYRDGGLDPSLEWEPY